jgi:hypothetical protein
LDGTGDLHAFFMSPAVLHHYNRVGSGRACRAGHYGGCLFRSESFRKFLGRRSRPDLGDDVKLGGKLNQVSGAHCVAVTGSSRERRKVTVGMNRFGQHAARSGQQLELLLARRGQLAGVLLHNMASLFKRKDH